MYERNPILLLNLNLRLPSYLAATTQAEVGFHIVLAANTQTLHGVGSNARPY
jgi:hypothetical protein